MDKTWNQHFTCFCCWCPWCNISLTLSWYLHRNLMLPSIILNDFVFKWSVMRFKKSEADILVIWYQFAPISLSIFHHVFHDTFDWHNFPLYYFVHFGTFTGEACLWAFFNLAVWQLWQTKWYCDSSSDNFTDYYDSSSDILHNIMTATQTIYVTDVTNV